MGTAWLLLIESAIARVSGLRNLTREFQRCVSVHSYVAHLAGTYVRDRTESRERMAY